MSVWFRTYSWLGEQISELCFQSSAPFDGKNGEGSSLFQEKGGRHRVVFNDSEERCNGEGVLGWPSFHFCVEISDLGALDLGKTWTLCWWESSFCSAEKEETASTSGIGVEHVILWMIVTVLFWELQTQRWFICTCCHASLYDRDSFVYFVSCPILFQINLVAP